MNQARRILKIKYPEWDTDNDFEDKKTWDDLIHKLTKEYLFYLFTNNVIPDTWK